MKRLVAFALLVAACAPANAKSHRLAKPADRVPATEAGDSRAQAPIIIYGRAENLIGTAAASSEGHVGRADFETRPLQRVGELLEVVPGLIVTQHSGSGKANQYFLRGFNLDHGTDFAGYLDGVPLNFRSHGHGQGYLDLNPIIPETIEYIDYRKGPYRADVGDFGSAGAGFFQTYDQFDRPFVTVEAGSHAYVRAVIGGSAPFAGGIATAVVEATSNNTAYRRKEHLRHLNGFAKWTGNVAGGTLRLSGTAYRATFDSTDQVPLRAVAAGQIDRLGSIDPTDGGKTSRFGVTGSWTQSGDSPLHLLAYAHLYRFKLWSDFTYFLDDPVNGDQFEQIDRRSIIGGRVDKTMHVRAGSLSIDILAGAETRYDDIPRIEIDHTRARAVLSTLRRDSVREFSAAAFAEATIHPTSTIRLLAGVRADHYDFTVRSVSQPANSGTLTDNIVSPKLSAAWTPVPWAEFYANYGRGFHSNDARGTVIKVDPATGDPTDPVDPLVRSVGKEVGVRLRPVTGLSLTATAWRLKLASELLFSGDGGSTEAQGPSARSGTEFAFFYEPRAWLTIDGEFTSSRARFSGQPPGQDRIPGAIERVFSGGVVAQRGPVTASLRVRHFGSFPVIEDDSRRSKPTTVVNGRVAYKIGTSTLALDVINLLDSHDNDITYFYTSRLPGEPADGVDDFHIHPIEPRQFRLSVTARL